MEGEDRNDELRKLIEVLHFNLDNFGHDVNCSLRKWKNRVRQFQLLCKKKIHHIFNVLKLLKFAKEQ